MGLISILDLQPIPIYDDDGIFENLLTEICDYLKIYNKRIIHSLRAIQHPMSFHCGYFCTGFILAMSKKYSLIQFQNLFTPTKLLENDKIICDFIISSLHSH